MHDHWAVHDAVLEFDGEGDNLCTAKDYVDFEMYVDWKIQPGGDSGIYLRGSPQVQIWDPVSGSPASVGSGGLYNNQKHISTPLVKADRPIGEWNTFYIRMVGENVTVWLNDTLVVDNVPLENYWEATSQFTRRAPSNCKTITASFISKIFTSKNFPIHLQIMRSKVFLTVIIYACIAICGVLCRADGPDSLPKAFIDGSGEGWNALHESDFVNVNCDPDTWSWNGDKVHCTGQPIGVLRTAKQFTNFEMVAQWKHLQNAGNSGIFVWADPISTNALKKGEYPKCLELQVLDHGFKTEYEKSGKKSDWFTTNGDLIPVNGFKMKPFEPISPDGWRSFPRKNLSRGFNQWNHYYVRCINGEVRLWVNGEEVSGCTGCDPHAGYVCLESEGAPIDFKGLMIRELP